jgi:hypothetical protein
MPDPTEVPPSLAPLTRRQALELSPNRFDFDTSRLLKVLDKTVGSPRPVPASEPPPRAWAGRFSKRTLTVAAGSAAALLLLAAILIFQPNWESPPGAAASSIFEDDFSSRANNWNDTGGARDGGHYVDGAYRIHTTWSKDHFSDHGFPRGAPSVYPTSPRDVRVSVTGRPLLGGNEDAGYGIACRADGPESYYQFALWQGQAVIAKVIPAPPYYVELDSAAVSPAGENENNRLEAICSTDDAQGVHLAFWVNGEQVARAADRDRPLLSGAVGLLAATGGEDAEAIEAEFDDFVVSNP